MTVPVLPQQLCGIPLRVREPAAAPRFNAALHPVLQRVLAARGVLDDRARARELEGLLAPDGMLNMDRAVALLLELLERQERILVVADFDADGATSCALAVSALRAMGFRDVDYLVPNRFEFGYGLTPEIVEVAARRQPRLLLTVDNGISSHAGVERANALGMRVLVTDHHLPGATLPDAACILNPNQPGCSFASKSLAGVGVVFYLLCGLRAALRERQWFAQQGLPEPRMVDYLDLVALGTVADVVPLDANNRRLVRHGLRQIQAGRARPGITALLDVAGRQAASIHAADLGFAVGPRLNAAGRLQDMALGIECLLAEDEAAAWRMAHELDRLNRERRSIEGEMSREALALLDEGGEEAATVAGHCLYNPAWHQGVIGILASRIKDRLHRPVIAFADDDAAAAGEPMLKGSARSIPGIHVRDVLDRVATRHPGLLSRFGGHAMAAGLSLRRADLDAFRAAFAEAVAEFATPEILQPVRYHDGALPRDCLSLDFARLLRDCGPWGQHFPEPVFVGEFRIVQRRVLGERHLKFVLQEQGGGEVFDAILFQAPAELLEAPDSGRLRALFRLDVNTFRGRESLQLQIELAEQLTEPDA